MPTPTQQLAALGLELPTPPKPVASYIPWRRSGSLLVVSGQIPLVDGKPMAALGLVGEGVTLEQAQMCARRCVLNGLAVVQDAVGDLAKVQQFLRVGVFVACGPTFTDQSKVANGASDLLVEVFGDGGRHARAAVGCSSLPLGVPVEVDFMVEVRD